MFRIMDILESHKAMEYSDAEFAEALKRCAAEPIHLLGAIQPNGILLGIDEEMRIQVASTNIGSLFGISSDNVLGLHLSELLGASQLQKIARLVLDNKQSPSILTLLDVPIDDCLQSIAVQAHRADGLLILELEPAPADGEQFFAHRFAAIRDALWRFDDATGERDYAAFVAQQMQELTGFDRVMVYKFDQTWDGEVIAESGTAALPSLLGNHFPASDIPPQARALYTQNLIRVLADTEATPVRLLPELNPMTARPLDLSHSVLRSMSPVHLAYMRNMGARASITVSILLGGRLWGMIACHHAQPRAVPFQLRELCEFVGKTVSMRLGNIEAAERDEYMGQVRETLLVLTGMLRENTDLGYIVKLMDSQILALVRSSGAVICIDDHRYLAGVTPSEDQVAALVAWLKSRIKAHEVFFTDSLGKQFADAVSYAAVASGLLAVALDDDFDKCLLWFRPEFIQEISWAGNPEKSLIIDVDGARVEPRRSFEVWRQTARGKSKPWSNIETDAAHALSHSLVDILTQRALRLTEQNYRLLVELSSDVVSRHDADGHFLFASPASRVIFQRSPDELVGLLLPGLCHPEDRAGVSEGFAAVARTGLPNTLLYRYITPQGGLLWVETTIKPVYAAGAGQSNTLVANSRDVTERQEYQHAIDEIQGRHAAILASAGEGVFGLDPEGNITFMNTKGLELLGFEHDEIIGRRSHDLFHATHPDLSNYPAEECPIYRSLRDRKVAQSTHDYFQRKNGEFFPVEYIGTPILSDGAVSGMVVVFGDMTEKRRMDDKLNFLAHHDPLTRLPNQTLLNEKLQQSITRVAREHGRLAMALIDFDHFKTINDSLGHAVGDIFLQQMALRLGEVVRREDILARWGGDEFVIVLEQPGSPRQIAEWAERVLRTLAEPVVLAGHDQVPAASMGLCIYPNDGDTPERLVKAADSAMYRAKQLGRNRFEFFTRHLSEEAERRFDMGWQIRRAVAADELLLYYQPQCAALDGRLLGLEALVRWQHPERGLVSPADFLPLADELGLLASIGEWVLRTACRQVAVWDALMPDHIRVSVNVAPVQLTRDFPARVESILKETGAPVRRLEIEITEGAMERHDDVQQVLERLRGMGFTLSVDDFGTGYSSLAHLRHLPIDCLKIDKSFIDGLPDNASDLAIVRTILALGSSLHLEVVAEGVETKPQLELLAKLGVETIQGYYFSRPLPAAQVVPFFNNESECESGRRNEGETA